MKKVLALILSVFILVSFSGCRTTVDRLVELKDNAELAYRMAAGVTIILEPDVEDLSQLTWRQMDTASAVLRTRLDSLGYWDAEVHVLDDNRIGIIFPKKAESEDVGQLIDMLSRRAVLEFRYAYIDTDENGYQIYTYDENGYMKTTLAMEGTSEYVAGANVEYGQISMNSNNEYYVSIRLTDAGRMAFKEATRNAVNGTYNGEAISNQICIYLDDWLVSAPNVSVVIDSTSCIIHGSFDSDTAIEFANLINSGSLPFGFRNVEIRENE